MGNKPVYENKVACAVCGDILVSSYRHDWVTCSCDSIYIDGGDDYWRRGLATAN